MITKPDETPPCSAVDPEIFFPKMPNDKQQQENTIAAKAICNTCPWKQDCLAYALRHAVEGIWGGATWAERKETRRHLGIKAEPIMSDICKRGHIKQGANLYVNKAGTRRCKKCNEMDKEDK